MSGTKSPKDEPGLDPVLFSALERRLASARAAELRQAEAKARIWEAKARKAESRANFESRHQRQAIIDQRTKRRLTVVVTVFSMVYLVGTLLIAPWVLAPTSVAAALAYRRYR